MHEGALTQGRPIPPIKIQKNIICHVNSYKTAGPSLPCSRNALAIEMLLSYHWQADAHYAEKRLAMKHTYWVLLFRIALFGLLAVLTPRSLSADRAGHAKSNVIRKQPYFNIATTQCIDYWAATSSTNVPEARGEHTAVWTGNEMIVWGGDGNTYLNTGARYNPITDSWTGTSTTNAPAARYSHTAVWTGSEMIVWGGVGSSTDLNTGGRYNASMDSWTATSTTNDVPSARASHTTIWTGSEMIVWGGSFFTALDSGGRYCASPRLRPSPRPRSTPAPRP